MERQEVCTAGEEKKWVIFYKAWGLALLFVGMAILWLILMAIAWAEAADASEPKSENHEYSFDWMDPDQKISVLQNRKFTKTGHPQLSLLGGAGFSDPYRNSLNLDARASYYFSEVWGIEAFYVHTMNSANSNYQALLGAAGGGGGPIPQIREIRGRWGGLLHFVPWYAKMNMFNQILYFDWYFGAGAGSVQSYVDQRTSSAQNSNYINQNLFALFLSTGHQYHLSQKFLVRLDLSGTFYQAAVLGVTGSEAWYANYNVGLGVGWKI